MSQTHFETIKCEFISLSYLISLPRSGRKKINFFMCHVAARNIHNVGCDTRNVGHDMVFDILLLFKCARCKLNYPLTSCYMGPSKFASLYPLILRPLAANFKKRIIVLTRQLYL